MSHIDQRNADWLAYQSVLYSIGKLPEESENDFKSGWNQGWTAAQSETTPNERHLHARIDALIAETVLNPPKTPAESRLIDALLAERNGVHSLPVKLALRAVRAERVISDSPEAEITIPQESK